jgi:CheY-like chemotaxis protein
MRILVIEDDSIDFNLVKKGFEVVTLPVELFHCSSAERVIEMLDGKACKVALLDLSLGAAAGLDVLKTIRQHSRFRSLPVIVFSSSGNAKDIADVYAAGANAYVEKPLTMELYRHFAKAFAAFWMETAAFA